MRLRNKQMKASSKPPPKKEKDHGARRVIIQIQVYFYSHYLKKKPRRITHGHEDIGVLDQFCAKFNTWCLYASYTKSLCKVTRKMLKKIHQG